MKELWRIHPVYYCHAISNMGRVKKIRDEKGFVYNRILSSYKDNLGYIIIGLSINGHQSKCKVHRLVLEAFIGPAPTKPKRHICNHKNGKKDDNRLSNLEWVTYSQNRIHAIKIGLIKINPNAVRNRPKKGYAKGEKNPSSVLKEGEVWLIKKLLHEMNKKDQYVRRTQRGLTHKKIAAMFKVSTNTTLDIQKNITWKHIKYP